jgi:ABC-type nitrate/sulfonate/bicarbonate transport system ATPase subunit
MSSVTVDSVTLVFEGGSGHTVTALENVSFELEDKKFAVIVGPSGCGQSSLLYLVAGLNEPSSGICKIGNQTINRPGKDRGMVFQTYTLFPWLNVLKTVLFVTHDIDEAIFLGDHVYVMSARPGRMIDKVTVTIELPRNIEIQTSDKFINLKRKVMKLLYSEVQKTMGSVKT